MHIECQCWAEKGRGRHHHSKVDKASRAKINAQERENIIQKLLWVDVIHMLCNQMQLQGKELFIPAENKDGEF